MNEEECCGSNECIEIVQFDSCVKNEDSMYVL